MSFSPSSEPSNGARPIWARLSERLYPASVALLLNRLAIAAIFFQSGRTKVDGLITVTPGTIELFEFEYAVPVLPPAVAAHAAAYAEHLFPILLVAGLLTRISAAGLLTMTAVIQVFVYPDAWPTHLSWAALMLPLIAYGGGRWSLDQAFGGARSWRQPRSALRG